MNINRMTNEEIKNELYRMAYWNWKDVDMGLVCLIRQCVKDSTQELLSEERIRNILYADETIDSFPPFKILPMIDKTMANVKAKRIFSAQKALISFEGKDTHVA